MATENTLTKEQILDQLRQQGVTDLDGLAQLAAEAMDSQTSSAESSLSTPIKTAGIYRNYKYVFIN